MKSDLYRADSAGRVRVPTAGIGLRVAPSVPDAGAPEFNKANQPGRLPLCARLDSAGGTRIAVPNSDALFMREPFGEVFLEGGEAGGWYAVTVFEAPNESVIPSALKTIVAVELMPAGTAVATAVPIASEGVPLRPGMRAVTTYFAGVLQAATLYVMKTDGTWFNTNETVDPSAGQRYDSRIIAVPGSRFTWVAAGAGLTASIEAAWEIG